MTRSLRITALLAVAFVASRAHAQWSSRAPMPTPGSQQVVVADANGKVHAIGGFNGSNVATNTHQVYDPIANTWATLAPLPFISRGAAGALGPDGKIYVAGGYSTSWLSTVAVYDVVANTWAVLASMPTAVWEARAAFAGNGKLYVVGGENGPALTQIYDPATNTWSSGAPMPVNRHQHALLRGADDKLYAFGGIASPSTSSVYTPATNTWAAGPAMPMADASMGAAGSPAGDRFVLTGGGTSGTNNSAPFFNQTWVFTVASQTWAAAPNLPTARKELGAAAVGCTVYAIGGSNGVVLTTNESGLNVLCAPGAPTTTTLTSLTNPSAVGQSVTFQATVTGTMSPTGVVAFMDGALTLGTAPLNGAGQASFATTALTAGTRTITAVYQGDANNQPSTSSPVSQVVAQAATTTTLTSSSNPSIVGGTVTFTATVAAVAPGAGSPTGTVTFRDGTTTIGTVTLSGGTATLVTSTLAVGFHDITASYPGTTNYGASTSTTINQRVDQDGVTVTLTSSSNPSSYTNNVTFTATVAATGPGGTPTGAVTFREGATTLGTSTLNGAGVATLSTSTLLGGAHVITADYPGSARHNAGSANLNQTVNPGASTTTLSSLTNPSVFGQSVTFTVTVTGAGVTPTGTITLLDGTTSRGTATLNGAGQATFALSTLSVATHPLTAAFGGDTNYAASTSSVVSQVVQGASTTTTLISSANPAIFGSSITFTSTVAAVAPGAGVPTGTVTYREGTTVLGTATLDASGIARLTLSNLSAGTHSLLATYDGTTNFLTSASSVMQVVSQDGVMVALTSSLNPSGVGAQVTFTAVVSSTTTGGTPTGTVTFREGMTTLGTGTLDASGSASFSTSSLATGSHSITAEYGGDVNHTGGSSAALSQVVSQQTTTLVTTSSMNPSVFGEAVTFTATLSGTGSGTPTGSIVFTDGVTMLGTVTVSGTTATFTTSTLGVGSHPITAAYGGDASFSASTALSITQAVNRANTTTAVASSSNPALPGASVTFTATVTASAPGAGNPGGAVTFREGTTVLGTSALNGAGVAVFSTSSLVAGAHDITASYGGDASFNASTSSSLIQTIEGQGVQTTLASAPNPSTFGASVTLTATVTASSGTPTGTVTFKDGTSTLGTGTLAAGVATFQTSSLSAGTHQLTAEYAGDGTFGAGSSAALAHVVEKAATSTTLSSSANPSAPGEALTLTATVSSAATGFTGQVEFFDGATSLGTAMLSGATATLSTSTLAAGEHALSATYGGSSDFAASTSSALTQTIQAGGTGGGSGAGGGAGGGEGGGGGGEGNPPAGCGCQVGDAGSSALAAMLLAAFSARRRRSVTKGA